MSDPQKKQRKNILQTLQQKPEKTRKKILWGVVSFVGIILLVFWVLQLKESISEVNFKNIPTPPVDENLQKANEALQELKDVSNKGIEEIKKLNKNLEELKGMTEEDLIKEGLTEEEAKELKEAINEQQKTENK